jgi:hypothetical protein
MEYSTDAREYFCSFLQFKEGFLVYRPLSVFSCTQSS